MQWAVVGSVIAVAVIGLALLTFARSGGGDDSSDSLPDPQQSVASSASQDSDIDPSNGPPSYKVVDLPESTRKKIYADHRKMIASSLGKSKRIPKSGVAGQSLDKMLHSTIDRNTTQTALINGVTDEDIGEIIAEGDAKGWK